MQGSGCRFGKHEKSSASERRRPREATHRQIHPWVADYGGPMGQTKNHPQVLQALGMTFHWEGRESRDGPRCKTVATNRLFGFPPHPNDPG